MSDARERSAGSPPPVSAQTPPPQAPRRMVVTSPRRNPARPAGYEAITQDIDEQTRLGQIYIRSLIRAQLRLAVLVCAAFGGVFAGMPLLFAVHPELGEVHVLGLPLPWLLLGIAVYPALIGGAWLYVRQAERNEREFAELVERS